MIETISAIVFISSLYLTILSLIIFYKTKRNLKKQKEKIIKKEDEALKKILDVKRREFQEQLVELQNNNDKIMQREEENKKQYLTQNKDLIDKELIYYYEIQKIQREQEVEKEVLNKKEECYQSLVEYQNLMEEQKTESLYELTTVLQELDDFRSKRAVINEQIRREQELETEIDSHRILLSVADKEDINFLLTIEHKINNKQVLYKLIWTEYLQRPFNQMLNNIFGSNIPKNVIYCIETIDKNKKYIGKTASEVSKRWTDHVKTSLNIGTVAKTKIHTAMFNHWDEFIFSVIEIVDKEKLTDREKYYISFFESDKYGFNIKVG